LASEMGLWEINHALKNWELQATPLLAIALT
jgi:hypothetical protein